MLVSSQTAGLYIYKRCFKIYKHGNFKARRFAYVNGFIHRIDVGVVDRISCLRTSALQHARLMPPLEAGTGIGN